MPQTRCEIDRQTCGIWYLVDWKQYTNSIAIDGWISGQDEDIELVGDCTDLPSVNLEAIFVE